MQGRPGFFICLFFVIWSLLPKGFSASAGPPDTAYRIFILHSYDYNNVCGRPQHEGVVAALNKAGLQEPDNLRIETYFMDTKRINNTEALIQEQARIALERIRSFDPHVVIILDDNAFRTVGLSLADTPTPVVFCGMNAQPETYHSQRAFMESRQRPGHNITGVYEKLHFADAIRVHVRLFPETRKVMILSDLSPTGRAVLKQIQIEMDREPFPCGYDMRVVKSWEEYKQAIFDANQDPEIGAIYPAALLLKDKQGNTYTAPEIFCWTVKHSTEPELAVNYAFAKMGFFGGATVDFHAMGEQAGSMAARIILGEDPANIPVEEARRYALVFNLDRARELGIRIPPDVLLAADEVIIDRTKHEAGRP